MFKIQSNNGMESSFQMTREISGIDARTILKTNIKVAEHKLSSKDKTINKYVDMGDAKKELIKNKRDYDRTAPETLTPAVQNDLWKKAKQLKDEFTVGMLSRDELHPIKTIMVENSAVNVVDQEKISTNRTVERNSAWYKNNEKKIIEYKNIMRNLCPDNPMASDVEKFRPRQRSI